MEKLKKANWLYIIIILLGLRSVVDANFAQAFIMLVLASLKGFGDWMTANKTQSINDDVKRQLDDVKAVITGLSMKATKPSAPPIDGRRLF